MDFYAKSEKLLAPITHLGLAIVGLAIPIAPIMYGPNRRLKAVARLGGRLISIPL